MIAPAIDAITSGLGRALIDGSALAVVTAVLAMTVLRRARPALIAALWTIVLVKFAVPVAPELPLSISDLIARVLAGIGHAPAADLPAAPIAAAAQVDVGAIGDGGAWPIARSIAIALWAVIALALLGRAVVRHRAAVRAARCLPGPTGVIAGSVTRGMAAIRVGRAPDVRVCSAGSSPYLAGLARPVLVVPSWLASSPRALDAAVLHELAHIRRKDLWFRWFEVAVRCAFFFWPVVHWVCRRLDEAREMACDEWACDRQGIDRFTYAKLLVAIARRTRSPAPVAATALIHRRSRLESRIDSLITRRSKPRLGWMLAAVVAAWSIIGLASAPSDAAGATEDALQCEIEPGVREQILASYPEADQDGDGMLSKREVCAHQLRMRRKLLDGVVDAELVSRIDPAADLDGDGMLSEWEIEWFKDQVQIAVDADAAVILQHRQTGRLELRPDRLRVDTATVAAPVCETEKCLEDRAAGAAQLLIDVAFEQP